MPRSEARPGWIRRRIATLVDALIRISVPVTSAALAALLLSTAVAAEYTNDVMPQRVQDARGWTFLGTVARQFTKQNSNERLAYIEFDVERVFARGTTPRPGDPVAEEGHRLALYAPRGDGVRNLIDGHRYLFSTASLEQIETFGSVAWEIHGNRAELVLMASDHGDSRFASVRTLDEGVALMVPDMPPTDANAAGSSSTYVLLKGPDPWMPEPGYLVEARGQQWVFDGEAVARIHAIDPIQVSIRRLSDCGLLAQFAATPGQGYAATFSAAGKVTVQSAAGFADGPFLLQSQQQHCAALPPSDSVSVASDQAGGDAEFPALATLLAALAAGLSVHRRIGRARRPASGDYLAARSLLGN